MMRADRWIIAGTTIVIAGLTGWGFTVGEYPLEANVFPALAAAGVLLFGALAWREPSPAHDADAFSVAAMAWLVAVLPVIYLLGFRIGLPVYALVYALARRTHPVAALVLAAVVAAVVELLFVLVLKLPLGPGWLITAWRRQ